MNDQMSSKESTKSQTKKNAMVDDFDYSKLTEEMETMTSYLEQLSEKIVNMKVECAIANIELASTIDGTDFESKAEKVEKILKTFDQTQNTHSKV